MPDPTDLACVYCASLPSTRIRSAGRLSRCPLCKGELLAVRGAGTVYRVDAASRPTGGKSFRFLVPTGLVLAVGLLAALGVLALERRGERPRTTTAQAHLTAAAPESRQEPQQDGTLTVPSWLAPEELLRGLPAWAPEAPPAAAPAPSPAPLPPLGGQALAPSAIAAATLGPQAAMLPRPFQVSPMQRAALLAQPISKYASEEELSAELRKVPEVDLKQVVSNATAATAQQHLRAQANAIAEQTAREPDAFVLSLLKRDDLAGLPLRLRKDCTLDRERASSLGQMSRAIRAALDRVAPLPRMLPARYTPSPTFSEPAQAAAAGEFWFILAGGNSLRNKNDLNIPALVQLLQAESRDMRLSLVDYLHSVKSKEASAALTRQAVFDLSREVREAARTALKGRPESEYSEDLLAALRYPWTPVVEHAVEALEELKPQSTISALVRLLDEPDPDAPFLKEIGGKQVPVVRELVQINHLRNCMLCHAPSSDQHDSVRGLVPVPGSLLPPTRTMYYSGGRDAVFVRADVTYLRQDFSVMQPNQGQTPWPDRQRFDYVVRTRPLAEQEKMDWEARKEDGPRLDSPYRRAVVRALCAVTGDYPGDSAAAWRSLHPEVLTESAAAK